MTDDNKRIMAIERQRHRILGAALKTFSNTGLLGTTISDVASEAGVSHGLVHHYFGSKEQLFSTLVNTGLVFVQETRRNAVEGTDEPDERIKRWVYAMSLGLGQVRAYVEFSHVVMQILGSPRLYSDDVLQQIDNYTQNEVNVLHNLILQASTLPVSNAATQACVAFNLLVGGQMFGMETTEQLEMVYEIGCKILNIDRNPVPHIVIPQVPWHTGEVLNGEEQQ